MRRKAVHRTDAKAYIKQILSTHSSIELAGQI